MVRALCNYKGCRDKISFEPMRAMQQPESEKKLWTWIKKTAPWKLDNEASELRCLLAPYECPDVGNGHVTALADGCRGSVQVQIGLLLCPSASSRLLSCSELNSIFDRGWSPPQEFCRQCDRDVCCFALLGFDGMERLQQHPKQSFCCEEVLCSGCWLHGGRISVIWSHQEAAMTKALVDTWFQFLPRTQRQHQW